MEINLLSGALGAEVTGIDLKDLIILCKNIRKFFKIEELSGKILSAGIPKNFY